MFDQYLPLPLIHMFKLQVSNSDSIWVTNDGYHVAKQSFTPGQREKNNKSNLCKHQSECYGEKLVCFGKNLNCFRESVLGGNQGTPSIVINSFVNFHSIESILSSTQLHNVSKYSLFFLNW